MKIFWRFVPWFLLALFATEIFVVMLPKKDGEFHTKEFGRLPVLLNGRIQPFDSVARNSLLQIRSTGDVPLEIVPSWKFWHHPEKLRSSEWLLEVFFKPELADTRPIFLIHHPEILSEFKLEDSGIEKSGLRYYTFNEIQPSLKGIMEQAQIISDVEDAHRTPYQKQILKLANAVVLYQRLKNSVQSEGTHDFANLVKDFSEKRAAGIAAFRAQREGKSFDEAALHQFGDVVQLAQIVARMGSPLIVPPSTHSDHQHDWQNLGAALAESVQTGELHPAITCFARMASAYSHGKSAEFNTAVAEYKAWLQPQFAKELKKGRSEFYYNQIKSFLHATIIYICAFILAGGALLTFGSMPIISESLRRSAFWLICLAFVVHTFGLLYRMYLEGRPPVTNLYSSAVFIGWGACILGVALERIYRVGLGSAVAAFSGFITLLIAHNLALGGDTMEMLQAVLDTNFWLATHVVVVTLGYSATFFAGGLAIAYIILGVFTPLANAKLGRAEGGTKLGTALSKMVYAIVCFATLFSFAGTVLGGIWADQSWGRFWGWDPKENGALLIVIWNVLILHARWGGMIKERGLMNLAVFGNIITAWSWFGTNMLGIGLHSYGFMDAAFKWLMLFNASQLVIIGLGLLPLSVWKSFRTVEAVPPANPGSGKKTSHAVAGA